MVKKSTFRDKNPPQQAKSIFKNALSPTCDIGLPVN